MSPVPQRFKMEAQSSKILAAINHTCQWERKPLEMMKSPVQWRSAATRQMAIVNAAREAGVKSAAKAKANALGRPFADRFRLVNLIRIRTSGYRSFTA